MGKRKAPENNDSNVNHHFTEFLIELANYERNSNRNIHKYNAYRKAASVLALHPKRIESGEEARKLSGIGEKIAKKIDEFIHTGKLEKLEKIRKDDTSSALNVLTRVSGIGPAKAKELLDLGINSIEKLHENVHKLNHHQKIGLKYVDDFEQKIPRSEIQDIERIFRREIEKVDTEYTVTICGSYRRGRMESGDIDVLITHPAYTSKSSDKLLKSKLLKDVVTSLERCDLITDSISLGDTKFMGVCKVNNSVARRIDIRLTPSDQFYCSILYFTGSDMFNKTMRAHALEQKFTLNEYSLRPLGSTGLPGEPVPVTSEEDIFEYINYPFKKPVERDM